MSLARLVITSVLEGRSKAEVVRTSGLSRPWVQKLLVRYAAEGEAASCPGPVDPTPAPGASTWSRGPHRGAAQAPGRGGPGCGGSHYRRAPRRGGTVEIDDLAGAEATGLVVPQPHKRPRSSIIRFCAEQPNERWQADITHWALAEGSHVEILNIVNDHSRLAVASEARSSFKAPDVVATFAPPLPSLPSSGLRQGRGVPPEPEEVAGSTLPRPPRPTSRLSWTPSGTTATTSDPTAPWTGAHLERLRRPPSGRPHRRGTGARPLPGPARPGLCQRCRDPAPQQPPAPHRPRPAIRRHPGPRRRPTRAGAQRGPRADPRPDPALSAPGSVEDNVATRV